MSGSSLDGIDLAICAFDFETSEENLHLKDWKFLKTKTVPFTPEWKEILSASYPKETIAFHKLHFKFGKYLGEIIDTFIQGSDINIDFIASHGHTLFHDPESGFSIQVGDGATISSITRLPVIADFRNGDMALGGQGTPLAPLADRFLLDNYDFYLNIGGIANITTLNHGDPLAYDICPANQILNFLSNKVNLEYDDQGSLAKKGEVKDILLYQLSSFAYFHQAAPKSLDNNWINENLFPLFNTQEFSINDQLATAVQFMSNEISKNIKALAPNATSVTLLTCGGGAKNKFLMECIKNEGAALDLDIQLQEASDELVDFKEAALIALMGLFRLKGKSNIFKSVTGASMDSCGGAIYNSHSN